MEGCLLFSDSLTTMMYPISGGCVVRLSGSRPQKVGVMNRCKLVVQSAVLALVLAAAAFSQTTSTIVGVVTDQSGAVIPACTVRVTNEQTGMTRAVPTGSDGAYIVTPLPPGTYSVEAEAAGFKKVIRKGILL